MRGLYILIDDTSRVAGKYTILKYDPQKSGHQGTFRVPACTACMSVHNAHIRKERIC
jgi:hypothetical protein